MEQEKLTPTEQAYYEALSAASPETVTRATLSSLGKTINTYARTSNIVDAHIQNLRRKLKGTNEIIVAVRGTGYRLEKTV